MNCHASKNGRLRWAACGVLFVAILAVSPIAEGDVLIFSDSWADGGRTNGVDPTDIDWWTSSSSNAIEVSPGSMGMVTGTSGRGIHTVFKTRNLSAVGRKIAATYTFTTPATVGSGTAAFRVGLFDTLGRSGLMADVPSSSASPNALYGWGTGEGGPGTPGLPGYMLDMDVATTTSSNDFSFREHDTGTVNPTGRLMGTLPDGFTQLSPTGPDGAFSFTPNTTYTGSFTIERVSLTHMRLTATLGTAPSFTTTDAFDSDKIGMLAFWANSNIFGSSGTPNTPDNGIDFSNIKVEFVPEPASLVLLSLCGLLLAFRRHSALFRLK
jgi:hypothetical protein